MTDRQALSKAKSIDIHAHAVLAGSMGTAGAHGPEIGYTDAGDPWFRVGDYRLDGVRYEGSPFMESAVRLANMNSADIDFQVLSPNPLTYFHHISADDAIRFCQSHNNALAAIIGEHPTRLAGFAALPMQDIQAACEELERAVQELDLLGAYIGTDIGRPLNDPALDVFYEKVVSLDVPLMIHPSPARHRRTTRGSQSQAIRSGSIDRLCGTRIDCRGDFNLRRSTASPPQPRHLPQPCRRHHDVADRSI